MIVYADVLIFLNLIVDYFLLLLTSKILNCHPKLYRIIISSIIGGISSLYIFLPKQNILIDFSYKIFVSMFLVLICFNFQGIKQFFRNTFVLLLVTCGYCGVIFAFWLCFKPNGLIINNSQIYFNISPVMLVIFSVVGYFIFILLSKLLARNSIFSEKCDIDAFIDNKIINLKAIVDTGNSLEDPFGKSEIIIVDKSKIDELSFNLEDKKYKLRYRILPCSTVSGYDSLEGLRCDKAIIKIENANIDLENPILAFSKVKLNDGYNAIINPKILR